MMRNLLIVFVLNFVSTWIGAFGALFLKLGAPKKMTIKYLIRDYKLMLGIILYVISTVPFLVSLKFAPLSVVYPFVSMSYIWIMILSKIFLKENINKFKKWAVALIIIGITLIGLSSGA